MVIYHLPDLNMFELLKIVKIINENIENPFNIYYLLAKNRDELIEFIKLHYKTYRLVTNNLLSFGTLICEKSNNKKSKRKKYKQKKSKHKKSNHKKSKCKNLIVV